jgi:hypothetical protein
MKNETVTTALPKFFPTGHWITQNVACYRSLVKSVAIVMLLIYFSILIFPSALEVVHRVSTLPSPTLSSKIKDSTRKYFLEHEGSVFASSSEEIAAAIKNLRSVRIAILDMNPDIASCLQRWIHSLESGHMKLGRNVDEIIELQIILDRVPPAADIQRLLAETEEANELATFIQYELKELLTEMGYDIPKHTKQFKGDEGRTFILYDDAHTLNQDTYSYGISDGDKQHHANRGGDGQGLAVILPHDVALGQADVSTEKLLQLGAPLAGQVGLPNAPRLELEKWDPPEYPKQLLKLGIEGATKLLLTIESGRVIEVEVISSTSNLFSVACRAAVKHWRYSLSPNKVKLRQTFRFEIPPRKIKDRYKNI